VIKELAKRLPDKIDYLQPIDARITVDILSHLMPHVSVPCVIKVRNLLGPSLIPKLCSIMSTNDMFVRMCRLNSSIVTTLSCMWTSHEKNLHIGASCSALTTLLDAIEHGAGCPEVHAYVEAAVDWSIGREQQFRDEFVKAGELSKVENILRQGIAEAYCRRGG